MFFHNKGKKQLEDFEDFEDLPEKTGLARFWELLKGALDALLLINLIFLATCIPVVTIPLALFALNQTMRKIVLDESDSYIKDYLTALKTGWKRAYGAFFLTALPMGIGGYGAVFYFRLASTYPLLLLPFSLCITVFLVAVLSSTYLYGFLADGKPLRASIRPALLLGVARPLRAILAVLSFYGLPLLAVMFLPLSGLYLFLIGFSLPCFLGNFYLRTVLEQFTDD